MLQIPTYIHVTIVCSHRTGGAGVLCGCGQHMLWGHTNLLAVEFLPCQHCTKLCSEVWSEHLALEFHTCETFLQCDFSYLHSVHSYF